MPSFPNKRESERFPLKKGAMIALSERNDIADIFKFGQILNICKGGLAFEYESGFPVGIETGFINIIGIKKPVYVQAVPYKIVYDMEIVAKSNCNAHKYRRCGLKFGKLSSDHVTRLIALLKHYCSVELQDPAAIWLSGKKEFR